MCGRYHADEGMIGEIIEIVGGIKNCLGGNRYSGDICPGNAAPVIRWDGGHPAVCEAVWGFPGSDGKKLIINARAESARQKRMFRRGIRYHRIAIPAAWFYEWNGSREKYEFRRKDAPVMLLAGFCDIFDAGCRFVILTTAANESVEKVHGRMPLILENSQLESWLRDEAAAMDILRQTPVMLDGHTEYEQQTLFQ